MSRPFAFRHAPQRALRGARRTLAAGVAASVLSLTAQVATATDTYTKTRYPVVLVHGLFGFDSIGTTDYFYAIPDALRDGGAVVYTPSVSASNSNEVRGEQLLAALRELKASYGYKKFNLIGHSQGGETSRYVASVAPDLVASVTTVGSPHQGSATADGLLRDSQKTGTTPLLVKIGNAFGRFISFASGEPGNPQNTLAALESLNTAGAQQFNAQYPQGQPTTPCGSGPATVNGIRYYSIGGTSVLTNPADPTDAVLALTSVYFGTEPNDGLVGRCSNHWGVVLRDNYPWNHFDEINQGLGLRSVAAPDPVAFYRGQANRLKQLGL